MNTRGQRFCLVRGRGYRPAHERKLDEVKDGSRKRLARRRDRAPPVAEGDRHREGAQRRREASRRARAPRRLEVQHSNEVKRVGAPGLSAGRRRADFQRCRRQARPAAGEGTVAHRLQGARQRRAAARSRLPKMPSRSRRSCDDGFGRDLIAQYLAKVQTDSASRSTPARCSPATGGGEPIEATDTCSNRPFERLRRAYARGTARASSRRGSSPISRRRSRPF